MYIYLHFKIIIDSQGLQKCAGNCHMPLYFFKIFKKEKYFFLSWQKIHAVKFKRTCSKIQAWFHSETGLEKEDILFCIDFCLRC